MKAWKFIQRSTLLPGLSTWALGRRGPWHVSLPSQERDPVHSAYLLCNLYLAFTSYYLPRITLSGHQDDTDPDMPTQWSRWHLRSQSTAWHPHVSASTLAHPHHHPACWQRGAVNRRATGPQLNRTFAFRSLLHEFPPNKTAKTKKNKKQKQLLSPPYRVDGRHWLGQQPAQSRPKVGPHHHLLPCRSQRTKKEWMMSYDVPASIMKT